MGMYVPWNGLLASVNASTRSERIESKGETKMKMLFVFYSAIFGLLYVLSALLIFPFRVSLDNLDWVIPHFLCVGMASIPFLILIFATYYREVKVEKVKKK